MTIPRIPGMFDALGVAGQTALQGYDQERALQYEQARAGAQVIQNLIQLGILDPAAISDPTVQQTFQKAKIPTVGAERVVPSLSAERARRGTALAKDIAPGSTKEAMFFDLGPTIGQVAEEDLRKIIADVRIKASGNPALARMLADVIPTDIAEGREAAARASIDPKGYIFAAENFVALANGNAAQAKKLAAADPQYSGLVQNGQLSDEYFALAARQWTLASEEMRQGWARIAAQRNAQASQERMYYTSIIQAYDRDISQMQNALKANELSRVEQIFLDEAVRKQQAGEPLSTEEQQILQKSADFSFARQRVAEMQKERDDVRDRFQLRGTPPLADPTQPAARREQRDAGRAVIRGGGAPAAPAAPSRPPTPSAPAKPGPGGLPRVQRNAGESDADYWERLRAAGYSPSQATAMVRGGKR